MKKTTTLVAILAVICNVANGQIINTYAGTGNYSYMSDSCGPYGGQATATNLNTPQVLRTDASGNVYVFEFYCSQLIKIAPTGFITSIAGNGTITHGGDGGPATAAGLFNVSSFNIDKAGNLYILEGGGIGAGCWIRKVDLSGTISTIAGGDSAGFTGDGGPATAARINGYDLAIDNLGNIFMSDILDSRIREINSAGIISTFAGNGSVGHIGAGDGGPATSAAIVAPLSVATDDLGNVYFCEQWNNDLRKVTSVGIISTVADSAQVGLNPLGITTDRSGNIFISASQLNVIKKIDTKGGISTVVGNGINGFSGDGGEALSAEINSPWGLALDASENLFIADHGNFRIRKVSGISTGVGSIQWNNTGSLRIWPVPNNGSFMINIPSQTDQVSNIIVTNVLGQKITETSGRTNQELKISLDVPAGIYFVNTITGQDRQSAKIIVK